MKRFFPGLFLGIGTLFLWTDVYAATLYLDPNTSEISPGDTIAMAVRLDTDEGECINVVDGVINFPKNISAVDLSTGNSILPVWVESPVIDVENNRITFAGGIPNGYCGRIDGDPRLTNILLEIIFQAPGLRIGMGDVDPVASITFGSETRTLLNDGSGTPAPTRTISAEVLVNSEPTGQVVDEWKRRVDDDTIPPNPFTISLQSDPSAYAGRYFIVFNTTDKQSGISHYEVMEEPSEQFDLFIWGAADAPWIKARSPYLLEDQSLNSTIRVRAVDKAGNVYVATFVPDEVLRSASQKDKVVTALAVTGGLIILVLLGGVWFHFYRRKKQQLEAEGGDINYDEQNYE